MYFVLYDSLLGQGWDNYNFDLLNWMLFVAVLNHYSNSIKIIYIILKYSLLNEIGYIVY